MISTSSSSSGLPRNRFERYGGIRDAARQVSSEFAVAVAPILLTPEEARQVKPYYLGMLSGHVILRDDGGFFAAVLDRLRRRRARLTPVRRSRGLRILGLEAGLEARRRRGTVTSDRIARDYLEQAQARRIAVDARRAMTVADRLLDLYARLLGEKH